MVEIADDDLWEFSSSDECDHILNQLSWSILGTEVAVEVKGDDVQGPPFEPDLRSSVPDGSR